MGRQQASARDGALGCAGLIGLVVVFLGLTWPVVAFYDEGPRTIKFNCATDWADANNVLSTGCSQNNINTPTGYTGHGTLTYYPTGLARVRPAGWIFEVIWVAFLVLTAVILVNLNRYKAHRSDHVVQRVATFKAQGYGEAAAKALAERAVREENIARVVKAEEDRKSAEEDHKKAEAQRKAAEAVELIRRLAIGTMARCSVCGKDVEASQGVILTHGAPDSGPWPRCEGSGMVV